MRGLASEFKSFILRGNMLDLAVAVVVGAAFSAVVTALVRDLLTPVIALVAGQHDFEALTFRAHHSVFRYGDFVNALVTFLSVSAAVFFLVVKPVNLLIARVTRSTDRDAPTRPCTECLSQIPRQARRCAFCTATQEPMAA